MVPSVPVLSFILAFAISLQAADAPNRPLKGSANGTAEDKYPAKLVEPLKFGDEFFEVTDAGTLRRRYRVWGDYAAEVSAWKSKAAAAASKRTRIPRTFRLGCIFLKDANIVCPDVAGTDGNPLRATYSTPPEFEKEMREWTTQQYSDFTEAFTGGEVKCEWTFETLSGLKWTSTGKQPGWGCQPRAIAEQLETALAKYKDAKVDMWVWCAGAPKVENGIPKQKLPGPPYGISYTQWQLFGGFSIVGCAPHLPLFVHEVNHRYLDNLEAIEGVHLTQFHGLAAMGYERGDLGYPDLLATYRSVYLHIIRPAMWQRFSLTGPAMTKAEVFTGKMYRWQDVADDCWFRLPLLRKAELAQITGLPGLDIAGDRKSRSQHFIVPEAGRSLLRSPYVATAAANDTTPNNLLSLATESCAVLRTPAATWLIVRPEVVDVYVTMLSQRGKGADLEVAGWINEGVCPLLVLRAPADLPMPATEIGYFR
jgi:hypothetical protein